MAAPPKVTGATFADLAGLEDERAEIIHGSIVERAGASFRHGEAQAALGGFVSRRFDRRPGGRWRGGWWVGISVHVEFATHELFCHDVAGWRRHRLPEPFEEGPVRARPDWVCEVLSPASEKRDLVDKMGVLRGSGVPHYWILNPDEKVLVVHRLEENGYLVALTATSGETVRAEPFDAVDLRVGVLFGDEDGEE